LESYSSNHDARKHAAQIVTCIKSNLEDRSLEDVRV
jgi:hypothetical protein